MIRRLVKFAGLLVMASTPVVASGWSSPQNGAASGDVKTVDSALYEAIAARNATTIAEILDNDFVLTNTFGEVYDKQRFLTACCAGEGASKTTYLGATQTDVKKHGTASIIVARTEMRFVRDNQETKIAWRSTRVYVKSGNRWKLAAEQRTTTN